MNESLVSNKIFLYIWSIWFQLNWMKTRRHRPSLIKQWNAITSLLTCRLLGELFGPAHLPGNSKSPNSSTFSYISNHSLFVPFIFIQPKIEFRIDVIFKFLLEMGKKQSLGMGSRGWRGFDDCRTGWTDGPGAGPDVVQTTALHWQSSPAVEAVRHQPNLQIHPIHNRQLSSTFLWNKFPHQSNKVDWIKLV